MNLQEFEQYEMITEREVKDALDAAANQSEFALGRFGTRFKHIFSTNQFYTEAQNDQWTNGFWTGELWLAYEYTGDKKFLETEYNNVEY